MKSRIDIKNAIAITVIIASFMVAIGLALLANHRASYWVAAKDLTPGHMIDSTDFVVAKASFDKTARGYLSSDQSPVGYSISKFISAGEYLNQSSLLENRGENEEIGRAHV